MTVIDFYNEVADFPKSYQNRDLQSYLQALYRLVLVTSEVEDIKIDTPQILSLLRQAFTSEEAIFDETWLESAGYPYLEEAEEEIDDAIGWAYTLEVLKFQITELHRMRGKQLEEEQRYFGVTSETGHRWYNFDPFSILECGARGMLDGSEETEELVVNSAFLGNLLELGRVYE